MGEPTTLCERLREKLHDQFISSSWLINPDGPEAATALEQLTTDLDTVVRALDDVQQAEFEYRLMHDRHGDGSQAAGRAWDLMRRAGDKAREALSNISKRDAA